MRSKQGHACADATSRSCSCSPWSMSRGCLQVQRHFELAWRYSWYEEISFWRSTAVSVGGTDTVGADNAFLQQSTSRARSACLQGLASYKTLAFQAQTRYGFLPEHVQAPLEDEDVRARACRELQEETISMLEPAAHDCSALVHMCFVKMGDLARCAMPTCSIALLCVVAPPQVR